MVSPEHSSSIPWRGRPFAIWPEDTRRDVKRAAARVAKGEDPWRSDAAKTAQQFARTILGWPDATTNPYEGAMACVMCFVVRREDGGPTLSSTCASSSMGIGGPSRGWQQARPSLRDVDPWSEGSHEP
jgi:hypothetical protein